MRMAKRSVQGNYNVRAVERAAAILEILRVSDGGASLVELASGSGLAKPSVFRMVKTLESVGFVERVSGTERYRLGVRCLELGQAYLETTDLRSEAMPILHRLRDEFDETVHLGVLDDELRVVYLEKLETAHAIGLMMSRVGRTVPAYCTGMGKALLAYEAGDPVSVLEERGGLKKHTPNTIFEPAALRDELAKIRDRGYSIDFEEHEESVRCAAAPIMDSENKVVGALSISGPANRMPRELLEGELVRAVVDAAWEVGRRIGARSPRSNAG
jgi:DNA-binding IclR family transcriptional regulator